MTEGSHQTASCHLVTLFGRLASKSSKAVHGPLYTQTPATDGNNLASPRAKAHHSRSLHLGTVRGSFPSRQLAIHNYGYIIVGRTQV